ncbi:MAG: alanine dehydrogenase [Acidimicrobiaceae bacterium]
MIIGVPKEIKKDEGRVAVTPEGALALAKAGHEVLIEKGAGSGSGISDEQYVASGAKIIDSADELWASSEMVMKVKEPVAAEYHRLSLRNDQILFTYLHLASGRECTEALLKAGNVAIAYETVRLPDNALPLLRPMSEVAGRMAPMVATHHLMAPHGGGGKLISGVNGVEPANVVVIGAGISGFEATLIAHGMQAHVTVLDRDPARLDYVKTYFKGEVKTVLSDAASLEAACLQADIVIGAVLVVGAKAPKLVSNELISRMKKGSVLVDIAVDQGGCFEATHATTHSEPTFRVAESILYCVANMPGAVPYTSTYALVNATLPYALNIANNGWRNAVMSDDALAEGVNIVNGKITYESVAEALGLPYTALSELL